MLRKAMSNAERLQLIISWLIFTEWSVRRCLAADVREYCNIEKFNVSCAVDSVIMMDYAFYGRQSVGRCVQHMDKHGKCGVDVLTITDSRCSGRRHCTIRLPDDEMYAMNACRESVSHLYAAYSCIPVAMIPSGARCDTGISLGGPVGYLTSVRQSTAVAQSVSVSSRCKWNVTVETGRTINVTLYDFGVLSRQRTSADQRRLGLGLSASECQKYAVIHELIASVDRPTVVCSGSLRTRVVYMSQTNYIVIETFGGATVDHDKTSRHVGDMSHFILKYQAAGCQDPVLPVGVSFRRQGNRGVITCDNDESLVHQYIVCEDNQWSGDVPDCHSQHTGQPESLDFEWAGETLGIPTTYGLMLVIILGVVLGVIVGALMLVPVLAYFKRRDRRLGERAKDEMTTMYCGTASDIHVHDEYHTLDSPVISKFLPLNSTSESPAIVAHYDTAGCLSDMTSYNTTCTGWHPTLSVVDQATQGVRLTAPPSGNWQLRRHTDQHQYELPK